MESLGENLSPSDTENLYQQLLLQATQHGAGGGELPIPPAAKSVRPKPGCCIKTKTDKDEKVFINICTGENLPVPKEISDEDLVKLLDSDDPSGFRVPMSLGEPHAELDKSGKGSTAYDVVINPTFYTRIHESHIMMGFFLTVVLEGLEYKYNMTLDREWKMLKNRKFVGSLDEQNIRSESKPLIMDMNSAETNTLKPQKSLISEVSETENTAESKAPEPSYTIIQDPPGEHPDFLVAEIHLPKVKTIASVTLDIGEDRIVLSTRSNIYGLDIYLPYNLVQEECGAQFNRKTKILTLTMPVQPNS